MNRSPDQLQNLADALGEDVVATSPETLAAEVTQERGDGARLALDFDRLVARAERQARWRRVAQWLRALAPSAAPRSWRPAMAAVAGVAVVVVVGDIYLNTPPYGTASAPQPLEQSRARDEVASRPPAYQDAASGGVPANAPAARAASPTPPPSPPVAASEDPPRRVRTLRVPGAGEMPALPPVPPAALSADPPRRVRTVPIRPTEAVSPSPAQPAPGAGDGRLLSAPAASQRARAAAVGSQSAVRPKSESYVASAPAPAVAALEPGSQNRGAVPSFTWPVSGHVMADLAAAAKADKRDAGIDFAVPDGTDVLAAADGVVAYAGDGNQGVGNLILVRHDGGFVTAYAHVDKMLVKINDRVRRGEAIATSGSSGTAATPVLHFEIRKGDAPVDARQYLPPG